MSFGEQAAATAQLTFVRAALTASSVSTTVHFMVNYQTIRMDDAPAKSYGNDGRDQRARFAALCQALLLAGSIAPAFAQGGKEASYVSMAPIEQYRMASRSEEIELARSAAPASISSAAEILVLGDGGYETAIKGSNGFVCLVERSWFASFSDAGFWNPKIRGPDCLNPAAVSSVLPINLERTRWSLAGVSKPEMLVRTRSSSAAHQQPAPGSMGYMMSKQQHLSDTAGHWHPHLMFFVSHTAVSAWGANLPGSPIMGAQGDPGEATLFFVPLSSWSDGTPASMDLQ